MNEPKQCGQMYSARDESDPGWWACMRQRGHDGPHRTTYGDTWNTGDEHHVSNEEFWETLLKNGREHPELLDGGEYPDA